MTDPPGPQSPPTPANDADSAAGLRTWHDLLTEVTEVLTLGGIESAAREARWIIEEASGLSSAAFQLRRSEFATIRQHTHLNEMVERRLTGEPLQYVFGHWTFRSLDLLVDRRVLIPRPETEQVAEVALAQLDRLVASGVVDRHRDANDSDAANPGPSTGVDAVAGSSAPTATAVDLGTGSGALALAIATERPDVAVWAVEKDPDAVLVARANLAGLGRRGQRVCIVEGSWFDPLPTHLRGRIDLLVANPPYVGATETLPDEVAMWEPAAALIDGGDGTDAYTEILTAAPQWLAPHGVIVFEIGETQGATVSRLAEVAGFTASVHPDLAGRDRIVVVGRSAVPPAGSDR